MGTAHEAFKALGPIDWDSVPTDDPRAFLKDVFLDCQCLVDSIPGSVSSSSSAAPAHSRAASTLNAPSVSGGGRPRSHTDSDIAARLADRAPQTAQRAQELRKEWKEIKVNPRENPLGVSVYKMGAKDGKGAWFARRSVHEGLSFERWKLGMEKEFAETLKVQGKPGVGNIRGIGADRRVESKAVEGTGKMEVYHLSAQFPGPTSPRDFVTLVLTSDSATSAALAEGSGKQRYFVLVSKPCNHPEAPLRSGFIRGQYESVEIIREIKVDRQLRKTRSSIDLGNEESAESMKNAVENLSKEAMVRSARQKAASSPTGEDGPNRARGNTIAFSGTDETEDCDSDTIIEWLMVTRSDPGGSVPRFMVEKGTPAGIAGDAKKFLDWITTKNLEDFTADDEIDQKFKLEAKVAELKSSEHDKMASHSSPNVVKNPTSQSQPPEQEDSGPGGFYGVIAQALGVAGSMVSSQLGPWSNKGGDSESDPPSSDDTSSIHSFHSLESEQDDDTTTSATKPSQGDSTMEAQSMHSGDSSSTRQAAMSQTEKELQKLEDRRRKLQEKMEREQERALAKRLEDRKRDESAVAKMKEKHEKEAAKREEKYRREVKKLEEKRAQEQRKAEEKRRKQSEREEKADLFRELEKTRGERDVALQQMEVLKKQIGELQTQNTLLVAKLGKGADLSSVSNLDLLTRMSSDTAVPQLMRAAQSNLN